MKAALAVFIAALMLLQVSVAEESPGFSTFGRSVTLNFAFHIGSSKNNDVVTYTDNYISSHDSGTVLAMASYSPFGTGFSELPDDYMLSMRQELDKNRFFLAFTKGDNNTIGGKINPGNMVAKTFGDLTRPGGMFPLYLRLEYDDIDITNIIRFGSGYREILVKNEGENEKGHQKVALGLIK